MYVYRGYLYIHIDMYVTCIHIYTCICVLRLGRDRNRCAFPLGGFRCPFYFGYGGLFDVAIFTGKHSHQILHTCFGSGFGIASTNHFLLVDFRLISGCCVNLNNGFQAISPSEVKPHNRFWLGLCFGIRTVMSIQR